VAKRIAWTEQAKADIRRIEQSTALQILTDIIGKKGRLCRKNSQVTLAQTPRASSCRDDQQRARLQNNAPESNPVHADLPCPMKTAHDPAASP
jgi:hypothetical protein